MKKYKIGIVTSTFPPKGGGIATAHYNIYQLLKKEHNVRVFAFNDEPEINEQDIIKRKTPTWLVPVIKFAAKQYLKKYKQNVKYHNVMQILLYSIGCKKLNKPIKRFNPDILIIPDNHVPFYWIKKRNFKAIWFTRNNYLRFRDNPLISNYSYIDIDIARSMERRAIKKADYVLSPSYYMIEEYKKAFNFDHPITVINNFLLKEKFDHLLKNQDLKVEKKYPIVYLPSAGTINKGSRYTYEIIRRISAELNYQVEFYLTGPVVLGLKHEITYLNNNVKLSVFGQIKWEQNLQLLNTCDLVVSPTLIENYSNAFIESFVLGKPIVTFDVGGNKEIVDDGINGYIVPYIDIEMLIRRSVELLSNRDKLEEFGKRAAIKAESICDKRKLTEQYNKFINNIFDNE